MGVIARHFRKPLVVTDVDADAAEVEIEHRIGVTAGDPRRQLAESEVRLVVAADQFAIAAEYDGGVEDMGAAAFDDARQHIHAMLICSSGKNPTDRPVRHALRSVGEGAVFRFGDADHRAHLGQYGDVRLQRPRLFQLDGDPAPLFRQCQRLAALAEAYRGDPRRAEARLRNFHHARLPELHSPPVRSPQIHLDVVSVALVPVAEQLLQHDFLLPAAPGNQEMLSHLGEHGEPGVLDVHRSHLDGSAVPLTDFQRHLPPPTAKGVSISRRPENQPLRCGIKTIVGRQLVARRDKGPAIRDTGTPGESRVDDEILRGSGHWACRCAPVGALLRCFSGHRASFYFAYGCQLHTKCRPLFCLLAKAAKITYRRPVPFPVIPAGPKRRVSPVHRHTRWR